MKKKNALGRGLKSLLGDESPVRSPRQRIPIKNLVAGPYQPRRRFDDAELSSLAESIRRHGLVQPILVRPLEGDRFEIIAGERRFRAAQLAGLSSVAAIVENITDEKARLFALIENLQRVDLNPIEQAGGLAQLIEQAKLTHEKAGEEVGLSRSAVSNLLRLLDLNPEVQKRVAGGEMEMGHARALLPLSLSQQAIAARRVVDNRLSVRQTEAWARQLLNRRPPHGTTDKKDADTRALEKELSASLSMRVEIRPQKKGSGQFVIHYGSLDSLDRIIRQLK